MATATLQYNNTLNSGIANTEKTLVFYVGNTCLCIAVIYNNQIDFLQKNNYNKSIDIETIIYELPLLQSKFKKVKIGYGFSQTSLVPNSFYNNNAKQIIQSLYDFNENTHKCFADSCETIKAEFIYCVPKDVLRVMVLNFPINDSFHFQSTVLQQNAPPQLSTIKLYCLEDVFCVNIWSKKKLLVSKTFSTQSHNLLCYNIFALAQMHNIAINTTEFYISGWVTAESALYKELYKYFDNIQFLQNNTLHINDTNFENHFIGFLQTIYLQS